MRSTRFVAGMLLVAACAACSTVQSRIRRRQARFDAYPADVRQKISQGRVARGFLPEQVVMALGRPRRVYRRNSGGVVREIWTYKTVVESGDEAALNLPDGESPSYGEIAGVDAIPETIDEGRRIVFEGGRVIAVETRLMTAMRMERR